MRIAMMVVIEHFIVMIDVYWFDIERFFVVEDVSSKKRED